MHANHLVTSGTLVGSLRRRAVSEPGRQAYGFLANGEGVETRLSFGELDAEARRIAALLQHSLGATGQRVLLLYPPGLEFVTAFLGCLYAGVVAVPAYPPGSRRALPRLATMAGDARPALVLTRAAELERYSSMASGVPELARLPWLASDASDASDALDARLAEPSPEDIAFLQYTSGSTATPKGVIVNHGNLVHNEEMIHRGFATSADSVIVGWLPVYHDMGLIGNVLQPLYVGARCILMPPLAFLQKPARWLRAVSRFQATISGGPDFAYQLCAEKVGAAERRELDLASWRIAFNGAEPVRAATLERFTAAFAECGFERRAFYPCYGLAEATLFVSGGDPAAPPVTLEAAAPALEAGRIETPGAAPGRRLVGCGTPHLDARVVIVDPETRQPRAPRQVGEIWIAGPSVARGYWRREEANAEAFDGRLSSGEGGFLRTGDLGFLDDGGELFVTGRLKDLVILRGRNLYPQDVEATARDAHPALRAGGRGRVCHRRHGGPGRKAHGRPRDRPAPGKGVGGRGGGDFASGGGGARSGRLRGRPGPAGLGSQDHERQGPAQCLPRAILGWHPQSRGPDKRPALVRACIRTGCARGSRRAGTDPGEASLPVT